jgi:hypothetical protein
MSDRPITIFAARLDRRAARTLILCLPGAATLRNLDRALSSALAPVFRGIVQDAGRVTLRRVAPVAA